MQQALATTTGYRQFSGVEEGELVPALPAGVPNLLKAITDAEIDFEDLAAEIGKFPSITARLLFLSNSAWAAPTSPVTSLLQACSKLGLSVVRSVSLSLSIAAPFNPYRCTGFKAITFWTNALLVAEAARKLAEESEHIADKDVPSVHTAAVLHNLGMLWFADRFSEEMNVVMSEAEANPDVTVSELMRAVSGADYCDIGQHLAHAWNFPMMLEVGLSQHNHFGYNDEYWQFSHVIGCASKLVDAIDDDAENYVADIRLERLGISRDTAVEVLQQMQSQRERFDALVGSFLSPM